MDSRYDNAATALAKEEGENIASKRCQYLRLL